MSAACCSASARADAAERRPAPRRQARTALPEGDYRLAEGFDDPELSALAFALGSYRFDRYRKPKDGVARLAVPDRRRHRRDRPPSGTRSSSPATSSTRRPTTSRRTILPARRSARRRGSARASPSSTARRWRRASRWSRRSAPAATGRPASIDIRWGNESDPKVTLVGKGIVFDTGGLDIKPSSRHGADEEGHGRRGERPRPRLDDHGVPG